MKRAAAWLLAIMMMLPAFGLSEAEDLPDGEVEETEAYEEEKSGDAEDVLLVEDPENGRWEYRSSSLHITVTKVTEKVKSGGKKKTREYCVADIQASPESPLFPVMTEASKKHPQGYKLVSPDLLIKKAKPMFAMSDDMYGIRLQRYDFKGIVIRNGEILSTKTRNSAKSRPWPNLDTMAFFGDGTAKTYICDAVGAEEYLAMGAEQVLSFGPILISEGEINPDVLDPKYYPYNEPRAAIGMVEPYHYVAIAVCGRPKDSYAGVHLDWMAEKLKEAGCVEALNLDGGQTVTMAFNGKIILSGQVSIKKKKVTPSLRSQGSLICFGEGLAK